VPCIIRDPVDRNCTMKFNCPAVRRVHCANRGTPSWSATWIQPGMSTCSILAVNA
jgi:hypothetical protein